MDYYTTLGLTKQATIDQIRKSYDFKRKELDDAFNVLSNAEKKAIYDRGLNNRTIRNKSPPALPLSDPPSPPSRGILGKLSDFALGDDFDLAKKFNSRDGFFGRFSTDSGVASSYTQRSESSHMESQTVTYSLPLTLEEIANGCTKTFDVSRKTNINNNLKVEKREVTIECKPGWKHGTKVTFPKSDNYDFSADIVFVVEEIPHRYFTREGDNIRYKRRVPPGYSQSSFVVDVPLLDGSSHRLNVPKVDTVKFMTVSGKGLPNTQTGHTGDLIAEFYL